MFANRPEPEIEKWKALAKYHNASVFYVVHSKVETGDTVVRFASTDVERTKARVKALEAEGYRVLVAKVEPQAQRSKWIYQTSIG